MKAIKPDTEFIGSLIDWAMVLTPPLSLGRSNYGGLTHS